MSKCCFFAATVPGVEYLSRPGRLISAMPNVSAMRGDICDVATCRRLATAVCNEMSADEQPCGRRFCLEGGHCNHAVHCRLELRERSAMLSTTATKRKKPSEENDSVDRMWSESEINDMNRAMLVNAMKLRRLELAKGVRPVVANFKAALLNHMGIGVPAPVSEPGIESRSSAAMLAPQELSLSALDTILQRLQKMEIDNALLRGKIAHLEARKYEAVVASTVFAAAADDDEEEEDDSD